MKWKKKRTKTSDNNLTYGSYRVDLEYRPRVKIGGEGVREDGGAHVFAGRHGRGRAGLVWPLELTVHANKHRRVTFGLASLQRSRAGQKPRSTTRCQWRTLVPSSLHFTLLFTSSHTLRWLIDPQYLNQESEWFGIMKWSFDHGMRRFSTLSIRKRVRWIEWNYGA